MMTIMIYAHGLFKDLMYIFSFNVIIKVQKNSTVDKVK